MLVFSSIETTLGVVGGIQTVNSRTLLGPMRDYRHCVEASSWPIATLPCRNIPTRPIRIWFRHETRNQMQI